MRARARLAVGLVVLAGCLAPPPAEPAPPVVAAETRLTPASATASEVAVAASPVDPALVVAAANSGGGFGIHVTRDAGESWTASRVAPADVDPEGGVARFRTLSDPALAFAADGTLYLAGLAYLPTSAVFVAQSGDGGATWSFVVVDETDPATEFNDKEWIGVSPTTGTVVVAWQKELLVDQLRAVEERTGLDVDFGDVVVARSTDDGATWTEPVVVSRGRHNNGTQVAFTPDGTAHLLWVNYETGTLDHATSADDGATWSAPTPAADVQIVPAFERYRRMHTLPALAASPRDASLYAVWHDARGGGADVFAVASADGGATWGAATRVTEGPAEVVDMYPWAAVAPDGRLHVTYYSSADDPARPLFRYWHRSAAGPDLAFGPPTPVSSAPFTAFAEEGRTATEPDDEARGLGDYTGLAASAAGVFAAWADGRDAAEAVWAARVRMDAGGPAVLTPP